MTVAEFSLAERSIVNKQNEPFNQNKLPFDVNDYLNFELNEDFISASADFLNDYQNDIRYSDIETDTEEEDDDDDDDDDDYDISMKEGLYHSIGQEPLLDEEGNGSSRAQYTENDANNEDLFSFDANYQYLTDSSFNSNYTPSYLFNDVVTIEPTYIDYQSRSLFKEKQTKVSSVSNNNYFPILDIHHEDFQCMVIRRDGTQCTDSILCTLHSYSEKYNIPRSEDLELLIRNFKYLKHLNEQLFNEITKYPADNLISTKGNNPLGTTLMKRHNSYQGDLTLVSHDYEGNLIHQKIVLGSIEGIPSNRLSHNIFIEALTLKLSQIKKNSEDRLLEIQYRNDLKNFAVSQLYQDNNFDME